MKTFFIGTLLKNSRGRAYLVYRGDTGSQKIYRLIHFTSLPSNGERVVVHGIKEGKRIFPIQVHSWPYRKRKIAPKGKVA